MKNVEKVKTGRGEFYFFSLFLSVNITYHRI